MAIADGKSPLNGRREDEIDARDGRLFVRSEPNRGEAYAGILKRANLPSVSADAKAAPGIADAGETPRARAICRASQKQETEQFVFQSHGAQFVEVRVDPSLNTVRVSRVVTVMDVGTILNAKTAQSQVYGGVIFGIGMALMEHTVVDEHFGRIVTRDLADYHVPVNADVPLIDVTLLDKPDPHINSLGARGIGEIGITGMAAAIANAVYHATGKRLRELPITPDKLLA